MKPNGVETHEWLDLWASRIRHLIRLQTLETELTYIKLLLFVTSSCTLLACEPSINDSRTTEPDRQTVPKSPATEWEYIADETYLNRASRLTPSCKAVDEIAVKKNRYNWECYINGDKIEAFKGARLIVEYSKSDFENLETNDYHWISRMIGNCNRELVSGKYGKYISVDASKFFGDATPELKIASFNYSAVLENKLAEQNIKNVKCTILGNEAFVSLKP